MLKKRAEDMLESMGISKIRKRLHELEEQIQKDDIWKDQAEFTRINQEISGIKRKIEPWNQLITDITESVELLEISIEEEDHDLSSDIAENRFRLEQKFDELETIELLSDKDDLCNAFLTIHPGAGGTESQDWASMILRMYTRWAEKNQYSVEVIDYSAGEEAGLKDATILIKGDYAFGYLKGESGVHRLVRISPFDSNKRRHTSFASVEVIPEIDEDIEIEINENDLKIDTYRASGAGGQHVNKTDSAVRITHMPTGIVVQCQNERSQHKNKSFAMKVLKSRLYELQKDQLDEKKQEMMGEKKEISWGNQIRSYVFQPYTLVKDHRTGEETGSIDYVFDGELNRFLYAYLKNKQIT
jgi:peptide chain release factor 2